MQCFCFSKGQNTQGFGWWLTLSAGTVLFYLIGAFLCNNVPTHSEEMLMMEKMFV